MSENNSTTAPSSNGGVVRYIIIGAIILAAFVGSYGLAVAKAGRVRVQQSAAAAAVGTTSQQAAGGAACACCGGSGGSSTPIEGTAALDGGVQKISVDLSTGSYDPNVIKLKAGVPAEITFGQSSGCTAVVESSDLGFSEDLTRGPVTVKLPALDPGTYSFNCGMEMVFGSIVVE